MKHRYFSHSRTARWGFSVSAKIVILTLLLSLVTPFGPVSTNSQGVMENFFAEDSINDTVETPLGGVGAGHLAESAQTTTFCSQDVPKSIPDPGTVTSTLMIDSDRLIGDLNVRLFIRHGFDADLDVFLTSPRGTRVELFTDVGGDGNNFGSTCSSQPDSVIDDQASRNIASGSPPFVGSFQSETRTLGTLNGEPAKGTWTLTVTDDDSGAAGTLNCWCLEVELIDPPALAHDVGISALRVPSTRVLGNSAPISVEVRNFGNTTQSNFPVSYQIDNAPPVTQVFAGMLEPLRTATVSFSAPWAPPQGTYRIAARTDLTGDEDPTNDAKKTTV